jgi:hypothetical protein
LEDPEVSKVKINGIECTPFKIENGWQIFTPDGVRPMTSIEKIEAGIIDEQVKEAECGMTRLTVSERRENMSEKEKNPQGISRN